ncbi:MAG: PEP-CTERM sorting domain-containing protein, partial [Bryobacteraceae bacterium]
RGGATVTTNCGFENLVIQAQYGTPTLSALGIASAADLRIVFNASEPGNELNIQLNALALTFYNSTGAVSETHTLAAGIYFPTVSNGTGNSGFVFRLDDIEATMAQAFIAANGGLGSVRIGLGASAGCGTNGTLSAACLGPGGVGGQATGGLETFFVESASAVGMGGGTGDQVPEPSAVSLLSIGLGLLAAGKFFRRS